MIDVRDSSQFISQNLEFVRIDVNQIDKVAKKIANNHYARPMQNEAIPFKGKNYSESAMWCFLVDSLNFCFWTSPGKEKWQVESGGGHWQGGYFGLIEVLKNGIKKNSGWLDPVFLRSVDLQDVRQLLAGRGELGLINERQSVLNELGRGLKKKNSAGKLIEASNNDVVKFIDSVIEIFPNFKDEAMFCGRKVGFYKRAQILAMDLNLVLSQNRIIPFDNIDKLTAFADYKLPQLFRDEGILVYNQVLSSKIDSSSLIDRGSREEVEIRGATVAVVELLKDALSKLGVNLSSPELDNISWTEAKTRPDMKPHHLTQTVFY